MIVEQTTGDTPPTLLPCKVELESRGIFYLPSYLSESLAMVPYQLDLHVEVIPVHLMAYRPRVTHPPLLRTLEMLLVQSVYPCTSVAEWITGMCQTA
jgi:hypothetical protein